MNNSISVQYGLRSRAGVPAANSIRSWAEAALEPQSKTAELVVRLVEAEEMQALNKAYRGKDQPTNVLSFPGSDTASPDGHLHLGDVLICWPVVKSESRAQNKNAADHLAHLVVHGVLHLQGHDHHIAAEAQVMENRERTILAQFNIADPYRS